MRHTFCIALVGLAACHFADAHEVVTRSPNEEEAAIQSTSALPELSSPPRTTAQRVIVPAYPRCDPADPRSPMFPDMRNSLSDSGFGSAKFLDGSPYVSYVAGGGTAPAAGAHARRLTRFVHLADLQLADDESPARMVKLDGLGTTNGAFRPQEGHGCRIVRAAVRTISGLDRLDALDFVLLGGDNADNAQQNEIDWVLRLLGPQAREVDCDSGADDVAVVNGEDIKAPFKSSPLSVPVKWVSGNHDILVQGNLKVDDYFRHIAIGTNPALGTRDYSKPGAPVTLGAVPADPRRRLHDRRSLLEQVQQDGDGHGITPEIAQTGKAIYSFDIARSPLRVIVLDTSAESGGSQGVLRQVDVEQRIIPLLDAARAEHKLIILSSHHGFYQLTTDGGALGLLQSDTITPGAWAAILDRYPEVVFAVVGHSHEHRVRELTLPSGRHFFEVMTASLMDFPGQFRLVEIFDQDNGWLMMRATAVDYDTEGDPVADDARSLMFLDYVSGWGIDGASHPKETNVELWVKKPK